MRFRNLFVITAIFMLLLLGLSLVLADGNGPNGTGDPDDPNDDNSCYFGGEWDRKCGDNEWLWVAGWYHIRFIRGDISYDQVPDAYKSAMPYVPPQSTPDPINPFIPTKMPL